VGCVIAVVGMGLPRLIILASWLNDPKLWGSTFDSQIWPILGFLFLPWTTFFYVLFAQGGFDAIRWIILFVAFLGDIGTWGVGAFGTKKTTDSYYRGT
jgi:hypothetical protein